jgi:outer membrane lipopolysaccharide assembly protein LptE/RlpB
MMRVRLVGLLLLSVTLTACGYTFRGSGSVLPPDVKSIFIPLAENNSTKIGLAEIVTESMREEFDSYGAVSVVDRQSDADAVLKVTIANVKETTSTVNAASNTAVQMDTTMFLAAELRRVTGPVLWRDNAIQVTKAYGTNASVVVESSPDFASGSISSSDLSSLSTREISRGQEASALNTLANDAARIVYAKSVAPDF